MANWNVTIYFDQAWSIFFSAVNILFIATQTTTKLNTILSREIPRACEFRMRKSRRKRENKETITHLCVEERQAFVKIFYLVDSHASIVGLSELLARNYLEQL